MKILVVEPDYAPYEAEINGLKEMQATVGGSIEAIYPFSEKVAVVCNDEGLINGLPFNRSMEGGYGGVFGTFFVCGLGEEDFISLTPAQIEHYKQHFHKAEILPAINGDEPVTMKVPPLEKEPTRSAQNAPEKKKSNPAR